jgi:DNA-binding MarR family transcriptional regulator
MKNRFENFTFRILQLSKLIQRIKNITVKDYGLKAVHVMCIVYLHNHPQGLTNTELVRFTLEDKAAISRALSHLKELELIVDGESHNKGVYYLTEKGELVAKHIFEASADAVNAGGAHLTEEHRAIFYDSLDKIANDLDDYYKELKAKNGDVSDE